MDILLIIFLILLNGIFSMSEIALVSSRKFKLESIAKNGNTNAKHALDLANNPNRFLSTIQIGITLIGILVGIFSGEKITDSLTQIISYIDILSPYAHSISIIIVVIIVTFFSIVLGELLPKRIGLLFPEKISIFMAKPMYHLSKISTPFIWLLSITNEFLLKLFGIKSDSKHSVTEEEIRAIIQEGALGGEVQEIEQDIIERVFGLGDRRVVELMTHRKDMIWLDVNDTLAIIQKKIALEPHSVYPVADGKLDKLLGVVSAKEMFSALGRIEFSLASYIKKPLVVHENIPAYRLLEKFRRARWHSALVVDEYGALQGVVSMDDVVDALLGDVSEYNQQEYKIIKRDDGTWLADGQYPYFELLHYFDITKDDSDREFNTIAGLILQQVGGIPSVGDKIDWDNFMFEIVDMDGSRIDKVLIFKK
ncbi:MAG: HlyC/CorC family transporter [Candidatus Pacebacteria bacterium]|nr:HlyC/CorC family transporter [Candidatus Paceibacterota bacterium]